MKITLEGIVSYFIMTSLLILIGITILVLALVAQQEGYDGLVSVPIFSVGFCFIILGMWNILMSFTYERKKYKKILRGCYD